MLAVLLTACSRSSSTSSITTSVAQMGWRNLHLWAAISVPSSWTVLGGGLDGPVEASNVLYRDEPSGRGCTPPAQKSINSIAISQGPEPVYVEQLTRSPDSDPPVVSILIPEWEDDRSHETSSAQSRTGPAQGPRR